MIDMGVDALGSRWLTAKLAATLVLLAVVVHSTAGTSLGQPAAAKAVSELTVKADVANKVLMDELAKQGAAARFSKVQASGNQSPRNEMPVPAYHHISSTNVALKKPTKQSSGDTTGGGISSRAVDGNTNPMYWVGSVTHTNPQTDPWWMVDLQVQRAVSVVRVTNRGDCCGTRLDLFTILVGDQVCGSNLLVPQGETGDFVCEEGPLVGSKVTIKVPGKGRYAQLAEVEVYEPSTSVGASTAGDGAFFLKNVASGRCVHTQASSAQNGGGMVYWDGCDGEKNKFVKVDAGNGASPTASAGPCYDGTAYAAQEACANCTGPGPSQCTACRENEALVPWRINGTVKEGSCKLYTDKMETRESPGSGSSKAVLMASVAAKWGKQVAVVMLPAVAASREDFIEVHVTCYVRKVVWCKARSSIDENVHCNVEKESRLAKVNGIIWSLTWLRAICQQSSGTLDSAKNICNNVEADDLQLFANVTSPHEACTAVLKLL